MAKQNLTVAPIDARTERELISMRRDNVQCGRFWMLTDGARVTIAEQRMGEAAISMTSVDKGVFDRFVRWYLTGNADMRAGATRESIAKAIA